MSHIVTLNAPGRPEPQGFTHVAVATGSRMVFLAGQVATDEHGELVGPGDLAAQTEQALLNVHGCLAAAGASFADVAKTTMYVVDWEESKLDQIVAGSIRAAERLGSPPPLVPVTLIPVPRLFAEGHLIEIDSTAVLA
jgi:enamine deaminase RidA (YjgF/YER057c/UK114 family)